MKKILIIMLIFLNNKAYSTCDLLFVPFFSGAALISLSICCYCESRSIDFDKQMEKNVSYKIKKLVETIKKTDKKDLPVLDIESQTINTEKAEHRSTRLCWGISGLMLMSTGIILKYYSGC